MCHRWGWAGSPTPAVWGGSGHRLPVPGSIRQSASRSRPRAAMNPGIHRRSGRDGCPDSHPISLLDCRIHQARPAARRDELPNPPPAWGRPTGSTVPGSSSTAAIDLFLLRTPVRDDHLQRPRRFGCLRGPEAGIVGADLRRAKMNGQFQPPFVPEDFAVPGELVTDQFRLQQPRWTEPSTTRSWPGLRGPGPSRRSTTRSASLAQGPR
jgi:hypothetical protein